MYLPGSKRFSRVLNLFGPIKPEQSAYRVFNTKVFDLFRPSFREGLLTADPSGRGSTSKSRQPRLGAP